jgi:hypothetical protein
MLQAQRSIVHDTDTGATLDPICQISAQNSMPNNSQSDILTEIVDEANVDKF